MSVDSLDRCGLYFGTDGRSGSTRRTRKGDSWEAKSFVTLPAVLSARSRRWHDSGRLTSTFEEPSSIATREIELSTLLASRQPAFGRRRPRKIATRCLLGRFVTRPPRNVAPSSASLGLAKEGHPLTTIRGARSPMPWFSVRRSRSRDWGDGGRLRRLLFGRALMGPSRQGIHAEEDVTSNHNPLRSDGNGGNSRPRS